METYTIEVISETGTEIMETSDRFVSLFCNPFKLDKLHQGGTVGINDGKFIRKIK